MKPAQRRAWFVRRVQSNRYPNAVDLAAGCGVSLDTAKRDIQALNKQDVGAPLVFRRSQRGYALSDTSWRMPVAELDVDPAIAVASARHLLSAVSPELASELDAAVSRLSELQFVRGHELALLVTSSRAAGFNSPHLKPLLDACAARRLVWIDFVSPWRDEAPRKRLVAPWVVQLHDNHLYLHGRCDESGEARCFSLAGISAVEAVDGPAKREPRGFRRQLLRGLGVGSGVWVEADIRLFGPWARYASHEVWHPAQVDCWQTSETGERSLNRKFSYALEQEAVRLLLSCGGGVEVRSPLVLRQALAAAFAAGAARNASDGREVGQRGR